MPLESDALPTALRGPAICGSVWVRVCVREKEREREGTYTVMSPVGNSTLKKHSLFFRGGINYYMYT